MSNSAAFMLLVTQNEKNNNKLKIKNLKIEKKDKIDEPNSPIFTIKGIIDGFWSSINKN